MINLHPSIFYTQSREWFFHMMKQEKDQTDKEKTLIAVFKFKCDCSLPNQNVGRNYERDDNHSSGRSGGYEYINRYGGSNRHGNDCRNSDNGSDDQCNDN